MSNIGDQLRAARKRKGLTQESVARAVDVTTNTVARAERGLAEPRLSTLAKIADLLEVPLAELVEPVDA